MPPKAGTASLQEYDIRITPVDQMPITKEHIQESDLHTSEVIIVAEEGGNPQLKLHYHLYVKARLSESKLRQICSKLGRATQDIKGNAVYSIRKAHTHTIGYVVKNKNIIHHNQEQKLIDEYFELSDDYKRQKEADKKDQEIENMKEEIKNLRTKQNLDVAQATKTDLESSNLPIVGKQIEQDTATAKALEHKHQVDAAVGNMYGHKLAQDANVALQMEKNLKTQNVGEHLRNQLLNLDLPVAKAVAQKALLDGKISEGAYAEWFAAARRLTESIGLSTSLRVK